MRLQTQLAEEELYDRLIDRIPMDQQIRKDPMSGPAKTWISMKKNGEYNISYVYESRCALLSCWRILYSGRTIELHRRFTLSALFWTILLVCPALVLCGALIHGICVEHVAMNGSSIILIAITVVMLLYFYLIFFHMPTKAVRKYIEKYINYENV